MKKYLIVVLILVFSVGIIFLPRNPNSAEEIIFRIEKGQGSKEIAADLQKEGLIWWSSIFRAYVLASGKSRGLQAGTYLLSPSMNIPKIAEKITSGDIAKEKITIIEGWNLKDIGFYFENKGMFQAEELYDEKKEIEGYFFPDTYEIRVGESLDEIIQRAVDNFNVKTAGLEVTPEVVTMASLIEKEVRNPEDKQLVSGILWKRLRAGIPLQVDATLTYITGKKTTNITKEDTQIDSPYNTYKYYGLPPGPICNPGLESIKAALYPKDSQFWYYLSTPDGETIFSKTLDEHNIAKAKHLK
ncbi:MAG: endolytic transglycosylase MltG [Candidatus Nealsonbacteria bacterium]|nr:MAG: endolytic transglycosylase MltG [Candidatus Nealsonbacteria bacterium]